MSSERERILQQGKKARVPLAVEDLVSISYWSITAAVLHLVSGIALIVASQRLSFTTIPLVFNSVQDRVTPDVYEVAQINVTYFSIVFELLAALRLFYTATIGRHRLVQFLEQKHANPYRWIEYSLSASVMAVAIAMLSGVIDILMLWVLFFLTAITMICGFVTDFTSSSMKEVVFRIGTSTFIIVWGVIYTQFLFHYKTIPWFVYAINIGVLLAEISFAKVQFAKIQNRLSVVQAERWFLFLEIASKLYLAWIAFGGALSV